MYKSILRQRLKTSTSGRSSRSLENLPGASSSLSEVPRRHSNIKRLGGTLAGLYRYRVGDYRVIYRIDAPRRLVFVLKIAHRSAAYD